MRFGRSSRAIPFVLSLVLVIACGPPNFTSPGGGSKIGSGSSNNGGTQYASDGGCATDSDGDDGSDALRVTQISPSFFKLFNDTNGAIPGSNYSTTVSGVQIPGSLTLAAEGRADQFTAITTTTGELALYSVSSGTTTMTQYVCWGSSSESALEAEAVSQGIWVAGCTPGIASGFALHLTGAAGSAAGWTLGNICE